MQLIDNFYNIKDWKRINQLISEMKFSPTFQPNFSKSIDNRLKGYPCHETEHTDPQLKEVYDILTRTLKEKTDLNIKSVGSVFRKIYTKEMNKSPFAGQVGGVKHIDDFCNMAGIIYFDGLTIQGGTSLFFDEHQFEPDITYAARPNRAILYKSGVRHCANHDYNYDVRTIQTIFVKC